MTMIVLFDDVTARTFEPFSTSRPLGEMRVGALLVRERWAQVLGASMDAFASRPALRAFAEFDAPPFVTGDIPAGSIVVNTRAIPLLAQSISPTVGAWTVNGRIAAVRLRESLPVAALHDGAWTLDNTVAANTESAALDGVWLDAVWDIIRHLTALLNNDIPVLGTQLECRALRDDQVALRGPIILGAHPVWLEDGATAEPFTVFDTTLGPVMLRRGSVVQSFTRVVGPCYVGRDSTVMADRISGSAIGDVCRVHGEVSATVFIGHANKGHDGFVGHSIVGRWANLGASTVTSNLKNTYGTVALWTPGGVRDSGLQFLGTLFGDHVKTGIGVRLTTGCVLGAATNVMDAMPPKMVAPFSWGTRAPYDVYALDKFIETAARMMARRHVTFDDAQRTLWATLHAEALDVARYGSR